MRRDRNTSVCPLFVSDGQLKALDTGLRLYHISVYKIVHYWCLFVSFFCFVQTTNEDFSWSFIWFAPAWCVFLNMYSTPSKRTKYRSPTPTKMILECTGTSIHCKTCRYVHSLCVSLLKEKNHGTNMQMVVMKALLWLAVHSGQWSKGEWTFSQICFEFNAAY